MAKACTYKLSNEAIQDGLSQWDQRYIRLIHVFKSVADVLIDDAARHPWKLPMYADHIIGTWMLVTAGTSLYLAIAPTANAEVARKKVRDAANDDINYELYRDSLTLDSTGQLDLHRVRMARGLGDYVMARTFNSLNREIMKLPNRNPLRRLYERTALRRRQSRALTVVS